MQTPSCPHNPQPSGAILIGPFLDNPSTEQTQAFSATIKTVTHEHVLACFGLTMPQGLATAPVHITASRRYSKFPTSWV